MNSETLLNQAAEAIESRGVTLTGYYHLVYFKDKIVCLPTDTPIGLAKIFETFSENNLRDGLTTKQWNKLSMKIINFYERETIKCLDQKH